MPRRFQFDAQWQRDFFAVAEALAERREHIAAGHQLLAAGVVDEAAAELALADEAQERIDVLEHALRDIQ
jgi:hypothetical protein